MRTSIKHHAAAAALSLLAASAFAAKPVTTPTVSPSANVSTANVTLARDASDAFLYSAAWNPTAGPKGDTTGLDTAFAAFGTGSFTLLDKVGEADNGTPGSLVFNYTLGSANTAGTWTVTNTSKTSTVTLDLVLALHAGNAATAFLFDNQSIAAGQTLSGDWSIAWTQGAGSTPGFSNLTMFGRDIKVTTQTISPVPEPTSAAMLLAGLGAIGFVARRRKGAPR